VDFPRWPGHPGDLAYTSWVSDPVTLQPYGQLTLEHTENRGGGARTPAGQPALEVSWSPDGAPLAFIRREQRQDTMWIMPVADEAAATPTLLGTMRVV
jgi:hypothetical protein